MRYSDDVALRLLEDFPSLRAELKFYAARRSEVLAGAIEARLGGFRLDPVEEGYVDPRATKQERERERIKIVRIGGENDLQLAEARARDLWKWERNSQRYRRTAPRIFGLIDLADKRVGKSRLIPVKPLGHTIKMALARLTPNQLVVYRGRALNDPPRTLGDLAGELGVSRKRIVALERRGRELMAHFLAGR